MSCEIQVTKHWWLTIEWDKYEYEHPKRHFGWGKSRILDNSYYVAFTFETFYVDVYFFREYIYKK